MRINMYAVRVRFVRNAKGVPLENKPRWVITLARDHNEASQAIRDFFAEAITAGIVLEYGAPNRLANTFTIDDPHLNA